MTPTQAQITAGLAAALQYNLGFVGCSPAITRGMIEAILVAAAAEVDAQIRDCDDGDMDVPSASAVATQAQIEAADRIDGELCFSTDQARWHLEQVAKAKAEMKERCAQVAEEYDGPSGKHGIAAAIRALRDKP